MECMITCHMLRLSTGEKSEPRLSDVAPGIDYLQALFAKMEEFSSTQFVPGDLGKPLPNSSLGTPLVIYKLASLDQDKDGRIIHGQIARAETGKIKEIVEVASGSVNYEQNEGEGDYSPLNFAIWIPRNISFGFIFCEKAGVYSSQKAVIDLVKYLHKTVGAEKPIRIEPHLPSGWVEGVRRQAKVKSIEIPLNLIKVQTNQDSLLENAQPEFIEGTLRMAGRNGDRYTVDKVQSIVDTVRDLIQDRRVESGGTFASEHPFGEISVELDIGGNKQRTYKLGSNDFAYPVVFFNDAVFVNGFVCHEYFMRRVGGLIDELKAEFFVEGQE